MSFELREWDDAWRYLHRFRELSETHGTPIERAIARSQIASLHWHQGDYDLALSEYRAQLETIESDPSMAGLHNAATLRANIGIVETVLGNWSEATENLAHAYQASTANNFDYVRSLVLAPLGLGRILEGRVAEGRRMVSHGLSLSFRSRYRRMHQIAADYAAGALAAIGERALARSVLDSYTAFRESAYHARSVSEEKFAAWVSAQCDGAPAGSQFPADARVSSVVAAVCEVLESPPPPKGR